MTGRARARGTGGTRAVAALVAAAGLAAAAGGCRPPPLWPLKNDVGGRCPYHKDIPRFELTYSYGSGPARTTLRLGWLGALVERAGPRGRGTVFTDARCLDRDTLVEVYRRSSTVLKRIEDTFAPHGAAILEAGWSETIEFTDEGKARSIAWLSQGPGRESGIPLELSHLLDYYVYFVRTLASPEGSPPLDPARRKYVPPEAPAVREREEHPPFPDPPGPPVPLP